MGEPHVSWFFLLRESRELIKVSGNIQKAKKRKKRKQTNDLKSKALAKST